MRPVLYPLKPNPKPLSAAKPLSGATAALLADIRVSELRYRRLFEASQDGILILDVATGRISDVNPFLVGLLGFSRDEMIGQTVGELSPFKDVVSNQAMLERLQRDGYARYHDLPLETKDGRKIAVEFVCNVYQVGDHKVIQCNIRDITEQRRAERAASWLAAIVESSDDAIIGKDLNSSITNWNTGAEKIFGYTAGEMVGTSIIRLIPSERRQEESQMMDKIRQGGSVKHFETLRQAKDGRLIDVLVTASPIKNATGVVIGVSKVVHDITARKRTEQALRESDERLQAVTENLTEGLIVSDLDGQLLHWNRAGLEIHGYHSLEEGLRRLPEFADTFEVTTLDGAEVPFEQWPLSRVLRGEKLRDFEVRLFHRALKSDRILSYSGAIIQDANGRPLAFLAINDITARKEAEAAVRAGAQKLRNVIDGLGPNTFLGLMTAAGTLIEANRPALVAAGLRSEEVLGKPFDQTFWWSHSDQAREQLRAAMVRGAAGEGSRYDVQVRVAGDALVWIDFSLSPVRDAGGRVIYLVPSGIVIEERVRTAQALRESEEHFRFLNDLSEATRTLADPAQIMAVTARMLGRHLRASRCAYADVEPDGEQFTILHDYTDGCASTAGHYQLSLFGSRAVATLCRGETLIIRNVEAELLPGDGADMFKAIAIQAIITCPLVKNGTLRAMMAVHQTTPRDWQPGEITIVQDVVERCWATIELRTAEEKIRRFNVELEQRVVERTAQLEAANQELEAFSYSVSHDLRAPLRHVTGFVSLLQQDSEPSLSEKSLRYLATISSSAKRMGDLIDDLLAFSRIGRQALQASEINLVRLVKETLGDFQLESEKRNIAWNIHPLPVVRADRALLRLVLVNLISNAVKFTSRRDEAKIEIGTAPGSDAETVIFIRDNGAGFDPRYADKLFGVFQRLHRQEEFEGTGIGLANVQRIIHRHGGRVWAEGALDGGATFYFSIPKTKADLHGHPHS